MDKWLLRKRRRQLREERAALIAKPEKTPEDLLQLIDINKRHDTIMSWYHNLEDKPKPISKTEFLALMKEIGYDTSDPKAVIRVDTRKQLDSMWPGIVYANVQIAAPIEVKQYFIEKLKTLHR